MRFHISLFNKVILIFSLMLSMGALAQGKDSKDESTDDNQQKLIRIQIESIKQVTKSIQKLKLNKNSQEVK